MTRPTIAVTIGQKHYPRMFSDRAWDKLNSVGRLVHHPGIEAASKEDLIAILPEADACITSWEVAPLDQDVIQAAPRLKLIVHMGGSVKRYLSASVWQREIRVSSAAPALAVDVAETALALILLGLKRLWPLARDVREGGWRDGPMWPAGETFGRTVGVVGAGSVGRHLIDLLQAFSVNILVYDPFLEDGALQPARADQVELEELLKRSDVVTLHAPGVPNTKHILNAAHLAMMKEDAVLVNTARGSLIDEDALIEELGRRDHFFAFLDVTDPEPPAADSPLRRLPNVVVTPHLAGCIRDCGRMSEWAAEEARRFFAGEPLQNPIRPDDLARIA
jgi:phosphoglycerate dehydrogenase-like enzyme